MLDGKWGKGKTYFIREYLIPKLKEKDYKVVYLSLNGVESIKQIKEKFVLYSMLENEHLNPKIRGNLIKYGNVIDIIEEIEAKGIGKAVKLGKRALFNLGGKKEEKKLVLIFDDLERISSKIELPDLLGHILDDYVEKDFKVLIVGNAKKIQDNKYKEIREKLFRRIVKFNPDMKKLIDEFLEKKLEKIGDRDYKEAIESKKEELISLICSLKEENLRTLDFFIDIFYKIFKCEVEEVKEVKEVRGNLFYNTLIIAIEFKNGGLTKVNIDSLKKLRTRISLGFMKEPEDYLKEF